MSDDTARPPAPPPDRDRARHARSPEERGVYGAERLKAFIDAVVAIAMTLLILPLMESVGDVAAGGDDTAHWIAEHHEQLTSFAISFVIIAMFWLIHHRLFAGVERADSRLQWLLVAWMLSIVWLPVATAISGQMSNDDQLAKIVYIGSMVVTCLLSLVIRAYLRSHPDLHGISDASLRSGMALDVAMATLFAAALLIALIVPGVGYFALFLMILTGLLQSAFARLFGVPRTRLDQRPKNDPKI